MVTKSRPRSFLTGAPRVGMVFQDTRSSLHHIAANVVSLKMRRADAPAGRDISILPGCRFTPTAPPARGRTPGCRAARALAPGRAFLMDEPSSSLDGARGAGTARETLGCCGNLVPPPCSDAHRRSDAGGRQISLCTLLPRPLRPSARSLCPPGQHFARARSATSTLKVAAARLCADPLGVVRGADMPDDTVQPLHPSASSSHPSSGTGTRPV